MIPNVKCSNPTPDDLLRDLGVVIIYSDEVEQWYIKTGDFYYHRVVGDSYSLLTKSYGEASLYDSYRSAVADLLTRDIRE